MIHQYQNNGYHIVLDVNSGSVHVVDKIAYDVIGCLEAMNPAHTPETLKEEKTAEYLLEKLVDIYAEEDLRDLLEAVAELTAAGQLFTQDVYESYIGEVKERKTVVKALCLHIAHDCNLACKYCFAEEGEYHGRRALMSLEVGFFKADHLQYEFYLFVVWQFKISLRFLYLYSTTSLNAFRGLFGGASFAAPTATIPVSWLSVPINSISSL